MIICSSMLSRLPTARRRWRGLRPSIRMQFGMECGQDFSPRDLAVVVGHGQPCHQVPEFANVSRPGMAARAVNASAAKTLSPAFSERKWRASAAMSRDARATGNPQLELAEAVEKILAESPLFHGQLKILIGGRDHAHVDVISDFHPGGNRLAIQHAEQFHS